MAEEVTQTTETTETTVMNQPGPETTTETETPNTTEETPVSTPEKETTETPEKDGKTDKSEEKAEGAPDQYEDFDLPEGMEAAPIMEEFKPLAKELDLNQEQAQKAVDLYNKFEQQRSEAEQERWDTLKSEWAEGARADKEFGGQDFEANVGLAKQALDQFGTPELKEALELTGTGSHPELVRFFYRVGKTLKEADMLKGGNPPPKNQKSAAEKIFTTMEK